MSKTKTQIPRGKLIAARHVVRDRLTAADLNFDRLTIDAAGVLRLCMRAESEAEAREPVAKHLKGAIVRAIDVDQAKKAAVVRFTVPKKAIEAWG